MLGIKEVTFPVHGDARGSLIALESLKDICFEMARIYYIFGTKPDVVRGKHAHKDLQQILICLNGHCDIYLDNGMEQQTVRLDDPAKGIFIHDLIWREMLHFSEDCVLLAIVDRPYDIQDYIFDYKQFLKQAAQHYEKKE